MAYRRRTTTILSGGRRRVRTGRRRSPKGASYKQPRGFFFSWFYGHGRRGRR